MQDETFESQEEENNIFTTPTPLEIALFSDNFMWDDENACHEVSTTGMWNQALNSQKMVSYLLRCFFPAAIQR
ncbi:MAG: hypothetical protein AAGB19_17460 [Cyanobacteria bacterium P01_F01_bin.3]